jgi:hypothetical protein
MAKRPPFQPTVRFHGTPQAGWHALGVCLSHGLPRSTLREAEGVRSHDTLSAIAPQRQRTFRPLPQNPCPRDLGAQFFRLDFRSCFHPIDFQCG